MKHLKTKDVKENVLGEKAKIYGWIEDKRPLGKLIFLTLRDQYGKVQLVVRKGPSKAWETCEKITKQSAVEVIGLVKKAPDKLEIEVEEMKVLSAAKPPLPLDPTGRTKAELPTILDSRPLSLRIPQIGAIFKIKSEVLRIIRQFFYENGFVEVNTPKIIASATEGGANLFDVDYFGRKAYLAQSPQLYKEQLMLYFERVFEIAQYFRAEKMHTVKHLTEFISVDAEIAYWSYLDVVDFLEKMTKFIFREVVRACEEEYRVIGYKPPETNSFKRFTYDECLNILRERGFKLKWGEDFGTEELKALGEEVNSFYFIIDWPKATKPFYIKVKEGSRETTESFDLMFRELELASGGTRVSDRGELEKRLAESGLNVESFKDHLRFFDCGIPPHAGFGLGLDRLMMILTGRKNIREVVLYPRDPERLTP